MYINVQLGMQNYSVCSRCFAMHVLQCMLGSMQMLHLVIRCILTKSAMVSDLCMIFQHYC